MLDSQHNAQTRGRRNSWSISWLRTFALIGFIFYLDAPVFAQSVCLPAPRLLTTMPMGGQVGQEVAVTIHGDHLEDIEQLIFSDPHLKAKPELNAEGKAVPNRFLVAIAPDAPVGLYEARVMTRLGISSSRIFSVGNLPEIVRDKANVSLETALPLAVNSVCNATMSVRMINFYVIEAKQGQRIVVDCGAQGIDSKLKPVLIMADEKGNDLLVERRGGALDYTIPKDGKYMIKVHDLTFQGGGEYFYRLVVRELPAVAPLERMPSTSMVSSFSWPPVGLPNQAASSEEESGAVQSISLPCDIAGRFFPAADVDTYEFVAKKGEVWWVEVASERLGLATDPSIVVQHVVKQESGEVVTDVAELSDIASPIKPSTNHYAYDGPPYDGGSTDILGKIEIKEDGLHRLHLRDLFGGTRNDPRNTYRLLIRPAAPDFALVAWALHIELRNGDRNALSKPITLRGGGTMAMEVAAVRRDGFDGPIDLTLHDLPEGVTTCGLRIPSGATRGIMLISAAENAPRGLTNAKFVGRAEVNGQTIDRPCRLASMAWPVPDAWQEIPSPRLLADVPVAVTNAEQAPLTLAAQETKVYEVVAGEKLTIPLKFKRRCEFSGSTLKLKTLGESFERNPPFDVSLTNDVSDVSLNLATIKPTPGEYKIAFYGPAVAKYSDNPDGITLAEAVAKKAQAEAEALAVEAQRLAEIAKGAAADALASAKQAAEDATAKHQAAMAAAEAAKKQVEAARKRAEPKDIVDIVVTEPISILVKPAENK